MSTAAGEGATSICSKWSKRLFNADTCRVKKKYVPKAPRAKPTARMRAKICPGLEAGLLLEVPDRLPRMVSRHLDRPYRPLDSLLDGLLEVLLHHLPDALQGSPGSPRFSVSHESNCIEGT